MPLVAVAAAVIMAFPVTGWMVCAIPSAAIRLAAALVQAVAAQAVVVQAALSPAVVPVAVQPAAAVLQGQVGAAAAALRHKPILAIPSGVVFLVISNRWAPQLAGANPEPRQPD